MTHQTHTGKANASSQEAIVDDLFVSNLRKGEKVYTDIPKRYIRLIRQAYDLGIRNTFVKSVVETVLSKYANGLNAPTEKQLAVIIGWLCEKSQLAILEALYTEQQRLDNRSEAEREAEQYGNDTIRLAEVILALRKELADMKEKLHYFSDVETYKREQAWKQQGNNKHQLFKQQNNETIRLFRASKEGFDE